MEKLAYVIREVAPRTWAVDEFSMNYMYILEGASRALVIDTGTGTGDFRAKVESLTSLPYDVVCTHGHVDHCGGIGQFPTIHLHPDCVPDVIREDGTISVFNRRRYSARGLALNDPARLPFTLDTFTPIDTSAIRFVDTREGDVFDLGGRMLEVIEHHGHAKGCICLYDRENGLLFSGDNFGKILILPLDMPHKDRAAMWLEGARKIEALLPGIQMIFTGHHCPLDPQILRDQLTLARGIIAGTQAEKHMAVEEYIGMLYQHGGAYFTLREENLKTRDYTRICNQPPENSGK